MFTFTSALIFISSLLSWHAGVLLIVHTLKKTKENQTNRASAEQHTAKICLHVSFIFSAHTHLCWHTQAHIEPHLTGLLIHRSSQGVYIVHYDTHTHTHSHYSHTNIHKHSLAWISFGKPSVLFKSSCELKLCPFLHAHLPFLICTTLRPAYLNNTVAPLNCKTNTVRIFAGLSAFSCFIGILECTFFSLKWIWIWHLRVK